MTTLSRRRFLKGAVALGAGAVLYRYASGWKIVTANPLSQVRELRLVHTNDHHARIEPASFTIGRVNNANVTRQLGGVARRKTLFDQYRGDAGDKLFLDAGDIFQGTLYFNVFNGKADRFFYNRLGYAASAIGNHEFDKGDQVLADFIAGVPIEAGQPAEPIAFPMVSSNMTAAAPSPLEPLFEEEIEITVNNLAPTAPIGKWCHRVIVTMPSGEKVGLCGLTTVETTNIASPSANVSFDPNYADVLNTQAVELRRAGCETVIAITHIGFQGDVALAPQLSGVNVIIGGHSHTPLLPDVPAGTPQPFGATRVAAYPQVLEDSDGDTVVVVQDWQWGLWVGDLVLGLDANGDITSVSSETKVQPVWAGGLGTPARALIPGEEAEITPDAAFQTAITDTFKPAVDALGSQVIGTAARQLGNSASRARENELGNLLADAVRNEVAQFTDNTPTIPLVAILNGGGIRANLDAGEITVGDVLTVMPFGNTVSRVTVTGAQLKAALENGVSALQPGAALDAARVPVGSGRFPNVSGMRYTVDISKPAAQAPLAATSSAPAVPARPGERITKVEIQQGDTFVPLDLAATYRVATLNFIMNGGDGYSVFTTRGDLADPSVGGGTGQIDSGQIDSDVVIEYISGELEGTVDPRLEGRITVLQTTRVHLPFVRNGAPAATPTPVPAGD
jgi:5'-nucleotidase / UDP-sugar diphosphatase